MAAHQKPSFSVTSEGRALPVISSAWLFHLLAELIAALEALRHSKASEVVSFLVRFFEVHGIYV